MMRTPLHEELVFARALAMRVINGVDWQSAVLLLSQFAEMDFGSAGMFLQDEIVMVRNHMELLNRMGVQAE